MKMKITAKLSGRAIPAIKRIANEAHWAIEDGLDGGAEVVLVAKIDAVQDTYNRPEPTYSNNQRKYSRSGLWQSGQGIETNHGKREIGTMNEARKYEPQVAKLKTKRRNPATQKAFNKVASAPVLRAFEQRVSARLGL